MKPIGGELKCTFSIVVFIFADELSIHYQSMMSRPRMVMHVCNASVSVCMRMHAPTHVLRMYIQIKFYKYLQVYNKSDKKIVKYFPEHVQMQLTSFIYFNSASI